MSSILTNNGAMVALQTMKSITKSMSNVQQEISTGKSISSAKDNAAVWAISKTMESDVKGFEAISSSLALGSSTIAVARTAAEEISSLLTEIKEKVIASQEDNTDRAKIQSDVSALRDQIGSIVGAAQFNGLNLIGAKKTGAATEVNILSSLNRADSSVSSANITVKKIDLSTKASVLGTGTGLLATAITASTAVNNAASTDVVIAGSTTLFGGSTPTRANAVMAGDTYKLTGGSLTVSFVTSAGDTTADITKALMEKFDAEAKKQNLAITVELGANSSTIKMTNNTGAAANIGGTTNTGGVAGGKLEALGQVNVTTLAGANEALANIEKLSQSVIQAAADFGTAQRRIDVQSTFVNNLIDAVKSGIGSLVDADMEATSAKLQALQVQQQLATQSLSIANQAPQNILALFK